MRAYRKYYIVMIVVVIAVGVNVASNESVLLRVQNFLGVPPHGLQIGFAEIKRPVQWLLIASRESPDRPVRLFGMFPSWFAIRSFSAPPERFFTFRQVNDPERATVTFIEENAQMNAGIAEIMSRRTLKGAIEPSSPRRRMFRGYEALEWRSSSMLIIYIPALRVEISIEPASSIMEDHISIAERRR